MLDCHIWGKVIVSQASVILSTGGVPAPRGVPGPGGVPAPGGGCLVETSRDGYCCGRYASYWNAFLFVSMMVKVQSL